MSEITRPPRILLFDSGMGGLTVAQAVAETMPLAELVYAADTAAFPYGAWEETPLIRRIVEVIGVLIDKVRPDVTVIACNTASTLAIWRLRERYPEMTFVGTVPAIKPAANLTVSGMIGVLATPGTVRREYTKALIDTYASHCIVLLHGAERLASLAEAKLNGETVDAKAISKEIAPVFRRRDGRRTDTVVLGCTHYPLLLDELTVAAPWPVRFIDPAMAIARRVEFVGRERVLGPPEANLPAPGTALFTGVMTAPAAFAKFGFARCEVMSVPR
ncbi:glutamate racemase [Rhodoligotrophos appendicifer]|uniref:glutamate racemase n=1 Tax=Rhodoligotrophos appendicifer TaxID=987056 RepID=UPI001FE75A12|nr:glutamate racemase [Rhodoligotrophos appendicifer]